MTAQEQTEVAGRFGSMGVEFPVVPLLLGEVLLVRSCLSIAGSGCA